MLPGELTRHDYLNGTVHLIGQFYSKLNSLVANWYYMSYFSKITMAREKDDLSFRIPAQRCQPLYKKKYKNF